MKGINMLLSSAGRRVELLEAFRQSAGELGLDLVVHATDLAPEWSAACQRADAFHAVPRASDPQFVPAMLELCRTHRIDLVVPTIDTELAALSRAVPDFAAIGTRVAVSAPDFVDVARDKLATAQALSAAQIPTVPTAELDAVIADPGLLAWPLLIKPRHGSSGRSISIARSPADLPQDPPEPLIAQHLLQGPEYTISMFVDSGGTPHCVIPHRRVQIRAGEVEKGVTERNAALCDMGWRIAAAFPAIRGVICFQVIVDPSGPAVFEINARFGGGYPLAHAAGACFTRWLLEEQAGLPLTANDDWRDGVVMLRYDSAIFLQP